MTLWKKRAARSKPAFRVHDRCSSVPRVPSLPPVRNVLAFSAALIASCSTDAERHTDSPDGGRSDAASAFDAHAPEVISISDAAPVPDAGDGTDAPPATAPPEIRSVLVATNGPFGERYDLGTSDVRAVLPRDTTAEVTVFARDDVTPYAALRVWVEGKDGTALPTTESSYESGIWKLTVGVRPGMTLSPRVADQEGNTSVAPGTLVLRSREDAVGGKWERRFFDPGTLALVTRFASTWDDATFTETEEATGTIRRGTFAFDGDTLTVGIVAPGDADAAQSERRAAAFVDDTAFSDSAYERSGEGTALEGTWVRSWRLTDGDTEEDVTETLVLGTDKAFTRTRTGTRASGGVPERVNESSSGTFRTAVNGSYTTGNVYFVGFTTTGRDGAGVSGEAEEFTEYVLRGPVLMLGPRRR